MFNPVRSLKKYIGAVLLFCMAMVVALGVSQKVNAASITGSLNRGSYEITQNEDGKTYTLTVYPDEQGDIWNQGEAPWKSFVIKNVIIAEGTKRILNNYEFAIVREDYMQHLGLFHDVNMTSVSLPASLTYVGEGTFYQCQYITSINFPSNLKYIGARAFEKAFDSKNPIEKVVLPEGLSELGNAAFQNANVASIHVPASLTKIGSLSLNARRSYSINRETGYLNITVDKNNPVIKRVDNMLLSADGKELIYFIREKKEAVKLTIPTGVEVIGSYACSNCAFENITLPNSVTAIEEGVFLGSSFFSSLVIPEDVSTIGNYAFQSTTFYKQGEGFLKIILPFSLTSIGNECFRACKSKDLVIPEGIKSIPYGCFYESMIDNITLPKNLETIEDEAFHGSGIKEIYIPKSVTYLGTGFPYCFSLEKVCIEGTLKKIKRGTFESCTSLKSVFYGGKQEQFESMIDMTSTDAEVIFADCTFGYEVVTSLNGSTSCKVEADMTKAYSGDVITVTLIPAEGYYATDVKLLNSGHKAVKAGDNLWYVYVGGSKEPYVSINATFRPEEYGVIKDTDGNRIDFPEEIYTVKVGSESPKLKFCVGDICHESIIGYTFYIIENGIERVVKPTTYYQYIGGGLDDIPGITYQVNLGSGGIYEYYAVAHTKTHGDIESKHTKFIVYDSFSISETSENITVYTGKSVRLDVSANGTNLDCVWTLNGNAVEGKKIGNYYYYDLPKDMTVGEYVIKASFKDVLNNTKEKTFTVKVVESNDNQVPLEPNQVKINGYRNTTQNQAVLGFDEFDELVIGYGFNTNRVYEEGITGVIGEVSFSWDIYSCEKVDGKFQNTGSTVRTINGKDTLNKTDFAGLTDDYYCIMATVKNAIVVNGVELHRIDFAAVFVTMKGHECVYQEGFEKKDETTHFALCRCGRKAELAHNWDMTVSTNATYKEKGYKVCADCGFIWEEPKKVCENHDFEYEYDDEIHVKVCKECQFRTDLAAHELQPTNDPMVRACECGYTHTHQYATEYSFDKDNHYHACKCGAVIDMEAHVPGPEATKDDPQVCLVCGYEIAPAKGIEGFWYEEIPDQDYTGKAIKPAIRVYHYQDLLVQNVDYSVAYSNNIKAGKATITVKGKGNFTGTETLEFTINPLSLNGVTVDDIHLRYTGLAQTIKPVVKYGNTTLKLGKDYTLSLPTVTDKGSVTVDVNGIGNYSGSTSFKVSVTEFVNVNKLSVKLEKTSYPYTGTAINPVVTVKDGTKELKVGQDINVTYRNNTNVGTASVVITGNGTQYEGSKILTFKITGTPLNKAKITGISNVYYTAEAWNNIPAKLVIVNEDKSETTLTKDVDYSVKYEKNVNAGTAAIIFTGMKGYTGTVKKTFKILPYDVNNDSAANVKVNVTNAGYSVAGAKPSVKVSFMGQLLKEGKDYTLAYANNKAVADKTATKAPTVTVTFKGNFKGKISQKYNIVPTQMSLTSVSAPSVIFNDKAGGFKNTKVVVYDAAGKKMTAGRDYDKNLVYSRDAAGLVPIANDEIINPGQEIFITIKGNGTSFIGSKTAAYHIAAKSISSAKVTAIPNQTYTGKEVSIDANTLSIIVDGQTLVAGTDFEIVPGSYTNNIKKGKASFTIRGIGNYGGTKKISFNIGTKVFLWWYR